MVTDHDIRAVADAQRGSPGGDGDLLDLGSYEAVEMITATDFRGRYL